MCGAAQAQAPSECLWRDENTRGWLHYVAEAFGLDPLFVEANARVENDLCLERDSPKGAVGVMQVMPETMKECSARMGHPLDIRDPLDNMVCGVFYLRQQYQTFGDWELAVAAYNAGPTAVKLWGGIPQNAETPNHVRKVFSEYERLTASE